jgi:hypothetical protein
LIARSSGQFPRDRVELGVFHRLFSTTDACDKVNDQTQRRAVIGPSAFLSPVDGGAFSWGAPAAFSEDLVRSFNGGVCFSNCLPRRFQISIDFVSGPETSVPNGVRVISGEQQARSFLFLAWRASFFGDINTMPYMRFPDPFVGDW